MYIKIQSKDGVIHKLLLARLKMLWIRLILVVDNLDFGGCGYLDFGMWITVLDGVCFGGDGYTDLSLRGDVLKK